MGRSPPTEERAGSYPSLTADVTWRLQQLVAGWQGAERNQPLSELHNECLNAAGPGGRHLLPARLLPVEDLDETHLQAALHRLNGKGRGTRLRFHFKSVGRFDSALIPTGHAGEFPDRWLLAIEENLAIREQVALYGHALGHLLLNNEQAKMDRLPALDPRDGYAHRDMLAELRMLETVRQPLDRRVLETYPLLTDLLRVRCAGGWDNLAGAGRLSKRPISLPLAACRFERLPPGMAKSCASTPCSALEPRCR